MPLNTISLDFEGEPAASGRCAMATAIRTTWTFVIACRRSGMEPALRNGLNEPALRRPGHGYPVKPPNRRSSVLD